jgi:glycosyltransferase involved in cell wall biosynthesis
MHRLLTDAALRETVRQAGLEHSRRFTWERTAQETVALYRQLLEGGRG